MNLFSTIWYSWNLVGETERSVLCPLSQSCCLPLEKVGNQGYCRSLLLHDLWQRMKGLIRALQSHNTLLTPICSSLPPVDSKRNCANPNAWDLPEQPRLDPIPQPWPNQPYMGRSNLHLQNHGHRSKQPLCRLAGAQYRLRGLKSPYSELHPSLTCTRYGCTCTGRPVSLPGPAQVKTVP